MQPPHPRVHDRAYVAAVAAMSDDHASGIHRIGDESGFAPGGYEIAALSAGAALVATEGVMEGAGGGFQVWGVRCVVGACAGWRGPKPSQASGGG